MDRISFMRDPPRAMTRVTATRLLRVAMRLCAIFCFIGFLGSNSGRAAAQGGLTPAAEDGPCSLALAIPAIVALVDEDFDLLLDDGRRVALAGLEYPPPGGKAKALREAAFSRLSNWLAGEQIFLAPLASAPDRWGRAPAQAVAAADSSPGAPFVSVGAALLAEGLARFRPDPVASPCAKTYLDAEKLARDQNLGVWIGDPVVEVSGAGEAVRAALTRKKGMAVVSGVVQSVGEAPGAIYLNFGPRRNVDFAVVISKRNMAIFERSGVSPRALHGRRIRVRGLIETNYGPRMEIAAPAEIEILDAAPIR
jgi:endonuclease YncB( thermonuclease family)